jgi:hypothetical protein
LGIEEPVTSDEKEKMLTNVYDIEPSLYRDLTQLCKQEDNATIEVLVNVVINTEYKNLESEQSGTL